MIKVTIKLFGELREKMGFGTREFEADSEDVRELLKRVEGNGKILHEVMIDPATQELKPRFKVMLNGRDIEFLDGLRTKIKDGDTLHIFPPIAGGMAPPTLQP